MAIRGTDGDDKGPTALVGTEAGDLMNGFGGDDELSGNGGNDNMHGDAGNDQLFGGAGNDALDGGPDEGPDGSDRDVLDGGDGVDTADYSGVQHAMLVRLDSGVAGNLEGLFNDNIDLLIRMENVTGTNFNDTLIGNGGANLIQGAAGTDTIEGQGGADRLSGDGGNDTIKGGGGGDTLIGSSGVDKLTGGSGADLFQYFGFATLTSPGNSGVGLGKRDVIADFVKGVDKIDLHFVDAKTSVGNLGNQAFEFLGGDAFSAEGQVRVFTEGGDTIVQASNDGDLAPEAEIQLTGVFSLAAGDFVL